MIQPKTQTEAYWVSDFVLTDKDIEQIYNYFLEVEEPQSIEAITRAVMAARVAAERNEVKRLLSGRTVYQPRKSYKSGEELVFPSMEFARGTVTAQRKGTNPQYGEFAVISVEIEGESREFASELSIDHPLNIDGDVLLEPTTDVDLDELYQLYGATVSQKLTQRLNAHDEFVTLGRLWFVKGLMADINVGHKHLSEAVLEMNGGGPLPPTEILPHLELGESSKPSVQEFSLNYALLNDDRFDEVGSRGVVTWFLHRLEPEVVRTVPKRLSYRESIPYDRALLNPQLVLLERELDDEWSELGATMVPQPVIVTLTYPHRSCGTLPLNSRLQQVFAIGKAARQRVTLIDEQSSERITAWVVKEGRFVAGLNEWYAANEIPVGGFLSIKEGRAPGEYLIDYDRRRPQREWVRLASVEEGRLKFELSRRSVGCGYDDLMIVGTDAVTAMDALFQQVQSRQRTVASLLAELFQALAPLSPQNTVHAKTLYSAINIMRRVPPGPLFAELVRHPAFQAVGDHYWQFNSSRWQG